MSSRINLLDWRAEQRNQRKQQYAVLAIGFVVLSALLDLGVLTYYNRAIEYQTQRNNFLTQQIAEMDKQIKEIQELERLKESLLARMRVIESLQQSRSAMVHFFDEIVNTLPEGVYLSALKQNGATVTLDGIAEANGRVSSYMKNFEASAWFSDPRLIVIKTTQDAGQRRSVFQLQVKNLTKAQAKGENDAAGGEAP